MELSKMVKNYYSDKIHQGFPNTTPMATTNGTESEIPEYIFVYVTSFNVVIFVTGILGNLAVIFAILRLRHMRTCMNYLLMSLSVADLLVLSVCQTTALLEFYGQDRWLIGGLMCKVVPVLENAAAQSSVLALIVISCERYYAVCSPLRHKAKCASKAVWKAIGMIWISACILSIPFAIVTSFEEALFFDGTPVHVCRTQIVLVWHYVYIFAIHVLFFVIPCFVMLVMYSLIIARIRNFHVRNVKGMSANSRLYNYRKQTLIMLISVVVMFFVCLTPMRILSIWAIFASQESVEKIGHSAMTNLIWVARILMYTNSACNPIIYGLISTKFRDAFKKSVIYCESKTTNVSACRRSDLNIESYAVNTNGVQKSRNRSTRTMVCVCAEPSTTNRRSTL